MSIMHHDYFYTGKNSNSNNHVSYISHVTKIPENNGLGN